MNENLSENILSGLDGIVTIAGVNNQTCVITGDKKQKKYNLTYEPIEINSIKAYFLVHLTFEDGTVNTYFLPIQFLGPQSVVFEVPFQVATMQFYIYGNLKLKDTSLKSVITDALTEEQKEALNKVTTNSEYWDRILAITNNLGNVITEKLEGSINTAINTITNSNGQMYWEDGKFICRDGSTDEESTMAMMISPGGFMIADSKNVDGAWDWRTFGTGKGFIADEIISGTLSAVAIQGVTITTSTLTGGKIIGAVIEGNEITGGTITGTTIRGSTIETTKLDATSAQIVGLEVGKNVTMGPDANIEWGNLPGDVASSSDIPIVPGYITSTKITQTTIESPDIIGGKLLQKPSSSQGGVYIQQGLILVVNENESPVGALHYDKNYKFYLMSNQGYPLRIESGDNMALSVPSGKKIYLEGEVVLNGQPLQRTIVFS